MYVSKCKKEPIMNITPVCNNGSFKGSIIFNNLKSGKVEKLATNKKMDMQIRDTFDNIINEQMFVMKSKNECLKNLKTCVKTFQEIIGDKVGKDFKYPAPKEISVLYSSNKDISKLDVPGYFSVIHSVK